MKNIELKIKLTKNIDDSYNIIIGSNLNLAKEIKNLSLFNNYAVITDSKVLKIYKNYLKKKIMEEDLNFKFISFKKGEKSKNLKTFSYLSEAILKEGFDRKSTVITFGGGVVGDMGGYVAGTFMRGIPFIQIPTTLLAMVDSSIGGKVAVDLKKGKNSSGLFYQPKLVLIDIDFLDTLTEEEYFNGVFEIIKHGIIRDRDYFNFISENIEKIKNRDKDIVLYLIKRSVEIKASVVESDEKEAGLRQILNFGHTVGHAIESLTDFRIKHGFAVGLGMIMESKIAVKEGLLKEREYELIKRVVLSFGVKEEKYNIKKLILYMLSDKKNIKENNLNQLITFILPTEIGKVTIKRFSIEKVREMLI